MVAATAPEASNREPAMDPEPSPEPGPEAAAAAVPWHASVTVRGGGGGEWSARVVLADGSQHDFHTPFELARFFARPSPAAPAPQATRGLR
jgi:hypothetical protein